MIDNCLNMGYVTMKALKTPLCLHLKKYQETLGNVSTGKSCLGISYKLKSKDRNYQGRQKLTSGYNAVARVL